MSKTIFAYGFELPPVEGFEPLALTSERSMLDAEIIVVEPSLDQFQSDDVYAGMPLMSERSSALFRETKARWSGQIRAALQSGRTVIVFLTKPQRWSHYTGERKNAGTAGRPRMTNMVTSCSSYDFVPTKLHQMSIADGKSFQVSAYGRELLNDYWREFEEISTYRCYFIAQPGWSTLLSTKGAEHQVAAVTDHYGGKLILLPELDWGHLTRYWLDGGDDGEQDWPEEYQRFALRLRDLLLGIDKKLRVEGEKTEPPEWVDASEFKLDSEALLEGQMLTLVEQMEVLRSAKSELDTALGAEASLRNLLFETGPLLEAAVRDALVLLGFEVRHFAGDSSEFDAIFVGPEGRFVGEVEGKDTKAVDVKKASQLHRNISEDFARDEVDEMATGVLFANAYRLTHPDEREAAFTSKVLTFAQTVGIALVSTPDLFAAARYTKNSGNAEFARLCREAIAGGKGKVVEFPASATAISPEVNG